jgi:Cdc6-like AAA superfamily ATPase
MIFNRGLRYTVSCDLCARQDSVERAIRWFEASHRSKPVHWVKGEKGSGKTVLLRHIAKKCAVQTNLPIATITFSDSPCGTLQHFIEHFLATVLDQLATRIPGLQDSLTSIGNEWLATNTSYANMPFEQQVDSLFISPLAQLISPGSQRPVLIIIDGLDHCDIGALDTLLEFMETTIPELPVYFIISGSHEDPDARTESRVCARLARRRIRKYLDENEVESFDHVLERLSPSASGSP